MKRTLLAFALASAVSPVFAAASAAVTTVTAGQTYRLCDGASGGGKVQVNGGSGAVVSAPVFTRNGFDVQCSSNVFLGAQEVSANLAVVGAASAKGNQYYGGHSNGGAITAGGACATTGCTQANTDTAIAAAVTAGSS
ncbi:MAG: hypothetical protein HY853_02865 [Burkholderiales bacterium]|nr:hypothetical protein [Burkholderiales bacterium]